MPSSRPDVRVFRTQVSYREYGPFLFPQFPSFAGFYALNELNVGWQVSALASLGCTSHCTFGEGRLARKGRGTGSCASTRKGHAVSLTSPGH